jgi:hypothetical protein
VGSKAWHLPHLAVIPIFSAGILLAAPHSVHRMIGLGIDSSSKECEHFKEAHNAAIER